MRKLALLICFIVTMLVGQAQTGFGTTIPSASALLEVSETNTGFLTKRISLIDAYD